MDRTPELLFTYLRDMIYAPQRASLDLDRLSPEYRKLGEGLLYFARLFNEQRAFAAALAKGDLAATPPGRENELAASLKALQASLRHLTWQSQQVAKGDYKQRIDFMGEFSEAFNSMIEQLEARQRALESEIEAGRQKANALEQSNRLLTSVTAGISQALFVVGAEAELLFQNAAAERMLSDPRLLPAAFAALSCSVAAPDDQDNEFHIGEGDDRRYFTIQYYTIQWSKQEATACVLSDVSAEKERLKALETRASRDSLTGLFNRAHGMQILAEWVEKKRAFSLCFVDLDNLKYVNDTFGHHEGDRYIAATAELLDGAANDDDRLACRIGGDEFMLLCLGLSAEETQALAELIRLRLQEMVAGQNKPYEANISYGVVEAEKENELTPGQILALADERMYVHKRRQKRERMTNR